MSLAQQQALTGVCRWRSPRRARGLVRQLSVVRRHVVSRSLADLKSFQSRMWALGSPNGGRRGGIDEDVVLLKFFDILLDLVHFLFESFFPVFLAEGV